jgi:hypothetical protein
MSKATDIEVQIAKQVSTYLAQWAAGNHPSTKNQAQMFGKGAGMIAEWLFNHYGHEIREIALDITVILGKSKYGLDTSDEHADVHSLASNIWHSHK